MAEEFCADCLTNSADEDAGDLRLVNASGTMFYGSTDRCSCCGSRVRTVWFVFAVFPIYPGGSYRVLDIGEGRHLSRKVSLNLGQTLRTWLVGYLFVVAAIGIWAFMDPETFRKNGAGTVIVLCVFGLSLLVAGWISHYVGSWFYYLGCPAIVAGAFYLLFWRLKFIDWPGQIQVAAAFAAPLLLLILPAALIAVSSQRPSR